MKAKPAKIFWQLSGAEPCACHDGQAAHERKRSEAAAKRLAEEKAEADQELVRRVERIRAASGMGERFLQRTFATYTTDKADYKKIFSACHKYAQNFEQHLPSSGKPLPGRNGFIISGGQGTGKTHIAAAIANFLLNRGTAVIFMTERNLLGKIRESYAKSRCYGIDGQTESEMREIYETVPLLVIDDLGKEKATEWTLATLYAIIDGRYDRTMPTIITTNYDAKSLVTRLAPADGVPLQRVTAEAIVDRLNEMCGGIIVTGESRRRL